MGAAAVQCSAVCRIVGKLGRQLKNFARSPNSVVPALTEGGTFKKPLEWGLVRALMIAISRMMHQFFENFWLKLLKLRGKACKFRQN